MKLHLPVLLSCFFAGLTLTGCPKGDAGAEESSGSRGRGRL